RSRLPGPPRPAPRPTSTSAEIFGVGRPGLRGSRVATSTRAGARAGEGSDRRTRVLQVPAARADRRGARTRPEEETFAVNIAYQPATSADAHSARPQLARAPHELVLTEEPSRARTFAKIVGLLAITALCAALATAIVAGTALFAL